MNQESSINTLSPIMTTYARVPVSMVKGDGAWLIDADGNRYLDAISGIAVCALGHSHSGFAKAISNQVHTLTHTSNLYQLPLQEELATTLCKASGMDNVFFCNSGAESNEAAIKLARMHAYKKGNKNPRIVVTTGAFHGRTLGALTATHSEKYQTGFGPLPEGFDRIPYNDIAALEAHLMVNDDVCAVMIEPIQGEGGVIIPAPDYLTQVRRLCDEYNTLLILDEVQTGNGRTGTYFAFQHNDIYPDILSTAKGLGNGFPIGATLARGEAASVFEPGHHATTFGGSPLACAAALAVYKAIEEEKLLQNTKEMGAYLLNSFQAQLSNLDCVTDIRGLGLMVGIELKRPCGDLLGAARDKGVLINIAAGNVIRLLPALITTKEEADLIIEVVSTIVKAFHEG